jgi:hypothetical protein
MGCGRSKGKIYLAANENIVKAHSATLQETELSMEEGATLLHIFSTMELETAKENAPMGVVGISFAAFSSKLAIKTSKFALNIFAAGCGLPAGVFPEQKLAGRMDSHQFLKCITDLCVRTDVGFKKYAFDLYKDRNDGISTKAMIKMVHETYDFCAVPGAQVFWDPKSVTAKMDQAESFIVESAGNDGVFQRGEFDEFVRKRHQLLQQVFLLQNAAKDKAGGVNFWKTLMKRRRKN